MIRSLHIAWACLKRNIIQMRSYRLSWLLTWTSSLFNLIILYFVAQLMKDSPLLPNTGGNYFAYLILGVIPVSVLRTAMGAMVADIRMGQISGTLETLLASPARLHHLLIGTGTVSYFMTFLKSLFTIAVGAIIFDLDLSHFNLPLYTLVYLITIFSFSGLGLMSAAFTLAFKRGDPVKMIVNSSFMLLGGVFFPITVLPDFVQIFAKWIPMYHATSSIRKTLLVDTQFSDIQYELGILFVFGILVLPLGLWSIKAALNKARRDGSLGHF